MSLIWIFLKITKNQQLENIVNIVSNKVLLCKNIFLFKIVNSNKLILHALSYKLINLLSSINIILIIIAIIFIYEYYYKKCKLRQIIKKYVFNNNFSLRINFFMFVNVPIIY